MMFYYFRILLKFELLDSILLIYVIFSVTFLEWRNYLNLRFSTFSLQFSLFLLSLNSYSLFIEQP